MKQGQHSNHCRQYANSQEAVRIIKYGTEAEKIKLFQCLQMVFSSLFIKLSRHCHITRGSLKQSYAEEAMNDALRIFIEQVNKGRFTADGAAALPTYLYLIFYRRYLRIWRQETRLPVHTLDGVSQQNLAIAASDTDIPGYTAKKLAIAMAQCGTECDTILTMTYLQGHSTAEIAVQMNKPLQTIKNRLVDCRKKLRTIINNF
jgi:DNA-directed RNA polymerase specialized sigma24 family protein